MASHGSDALEIVNVTDPASPVHAGRLDDGSGVAPFLDNPLSLFISGNYAYVASSQDNRFEIVDVTDPENPVHKGSIQDGDNGAFLNNPFCVFVSGKYAYIASENSNALEIIDIGTITAASVNVVSPTHITCTVNLTGAVPGTIQRCCNQPGWIIWHTSRRVHGYRCNTHNPNAHSYPNTDPHSYFHDYHSSNSDTNLDTCTLR